MQLWSGDLRDFVSEAGGTLVGHLVGAYYKHHGHQASKSEVRSWEFSLESLASSFDCIKDRDIQVAVEYHIPFCGYRADVLLFGRDREAEKKALVIELKQWSEVAIGDEFSLNVLAGGQEHVHPSQQALDYALFLTGVHSAFADDGIKVSACAYCHNLDTDYQHILGEGRFNELVKTSPFFLAGQESKLIDWVVAQVGFGGGREVFVKFDSGKFKPSKKLLSHIHETLSNETEWHLLGVQREAFNEIVSSLFKTRKRRQKLAVLVRGGPGTGKTVIAIQVLADALRRGYSAAHSTGGKAFTTILRSKFPKAKEVFIWNLNTRSEPTESIDLLLVDEAHRIRETSDTRFTKAAERNKKSQIQELLDCSRVTVFFLDENQFVRPDEVGRTDLVRTATKNLGVPLKEFDLDAQFRCGGCLEYVHFVDYVLGFRKQIPDSWGERFKFSILDDVSKINPTMDAAKSSGGSCRVLAGFCWNWSEPREDGSLVADVVLNGWSRPWNAKRKEGKQYTPSQDPYTKWAETEEGEQQVGCIYSAQGFEFDEVIVIWGLDLVWRDNQWVFQKDWCKDKPVKARGSNSLELVRNAYRVLMTRGIKAVHLYVCDPETRLYILSLMRDVARQASPSPA